MNLQQLLDNLNSRDLVLRGDAERRLRALTPDELTAFTRLEQADFRRWARRQWIKIILGWMVWTALFFALLELFAEIHWHISGGFGMPFLAGLGALVSGKKSRQMYLSLMPCQFSPSRVRIQPLHFSDLPM